MSPSCELLLAVDTAGADAGLALAGDGFVDVLRLPLGPGGQARTEDLAACASVLLSARGRQPRDLAILGAVVGPGSYTGLRSGLAFLGGLALAGRLPVVAVGSLELLAWRGASPGETVTVWWPAGSGRAMTAAYRRGDDGQDVVEVDAARVVEEGEPTGLAPAAAVVVTAPAAGAVRALGLEVRVPEGDSLAGLAQLARSRWQRGLGRPAAEALPVYVGQSTARPNRHRVAVPEAPE